MSENEINLKQAVESAPSAGNEVVAQVSSGAEPTWDDLYGDMPRSLRGAIGTRPMTVGEIANRFGVSIEDIYDMPRSSRPRVRR